MSSPSSAMTDSLTMLRRNLRHALRYPSMTVAVVATPILMLLLFVYVFGGAIGSSLASVPHGAKYIDYLVPGILLMTVCSWTMTTAVAVCTDMSEGIVARFRTMRISRAALLTGHVAGTVIQTMVSLILVVGVALAMGFRTGAGVEAWLAALAVLAMLSLAITWLAVGIGLASKEPEGASNSVLPLSLLLPFLSSAFAPLTSMPGWVRAFAANQPFTQVIETLRGLLIGGPIGGHGAVAVAWCAGIAVVGYVWSKKLYNRGPSR
jgi:ABC-2 type transport system permease protein